jgi:hypothetical protein
MVDDFCEVMNVDFCDGDEDGCDFRSLIGIWWHVELEKGEEMVWGREKKLYWGARRNGMWAGLFNGCLCSVHKFYLCIITSPPIVYMLVLYTKVFVFLTF